jgi:hypothetical protein
MNPWPISPLGPKDLDFAVVNYGFTDLTGNEISPLPPIESAMDLLAEDIAASLADQAVLIASMDGIFDDFANVINELESDNSEQVLGLFAGIESAGTGLLNDYVTLVGPSNSGGGGGGGGGGCGTAACDFSTAMNDVPLHSPPVTSGIPLSNNSNQDIQITDAKLSTPDPDILSATVPTPQTVKPNTSIVGTVTVTPGRVGTFCIEIALTAVGFSRPNIICVEVNVVAPTSGAVARAASHGTLFQGVAH